MPGTTIPSLRIAIIGGGPGGLATAISLLKLPNVEVTIYEKARELREIGAGIHVGYNSWKILELLGAAQDVKGHYSKEILHRNGLTGEAINDYPVGDFEPKYRLRRARRSRLQAALIKQVPDGIIKLQKRLVSIENIEDGGVSLSFEDGEKVIADLVVGGDGIRSVVRQAIFPDYVTKFTGRTTWRLLMRRSLISHLPELIDPVTWWHGPEGHVFNSLVDDEDETPEDEQLLEFSVHNVVPADSVKEKRYSWAIPATNARVEQFFTHYHPKVREALSKVPEGSWREFSAFSGPGVETTIAWDKVVLVGDASHPLTGAFGSGAAFAMQDGWILAQALQYTSSDPQRIGAALKIFDSIRSPYYKQLYEFLEKQAKIGQDIKEKHPDLSFDASLDLRLKQSAALNRDHRPEIREVDIQHVWNDWVAAQNRV